jgi:hypothetical protein
MIPQTPSAKVVVERGLADPGPQGQVIRDLHARPEKVYVTDKAGPLEKLAGSNGDNLLGLFRPNMGKDYTLFINSKAHEKLPKEELINTLAHESGHGMAQVTGIGGVRQPTGIGLIDMLANGVLGGRVEAGLNEDLADSLSGLYASKAAGAKAGTKVGELARMVMKRKVK